MDLLAMSVDELADHHKGLKEQMSSLRDEVWKIERELDNRMLAINATEIVGQNVSVRKTTTKKYGYDQGLIVMASHSAESEGVLGEFNDAFQQTWEVKRNPLKALLRRGGKTAELIRQAESVLSEQAKFEVRPL